MPVSTPLLDTIGGHADLAALPTAELIRLAAELRALITETVSRNGGHLASNLGLVELTIALHRAYDFQVDRLVFDVGHQCYAHKLLTGRRGRFPTLRQRHGLAGFPAPEESAADPFRVGHASTSISSALGLALAYARRAGIPPSPAEGRAANERAFADARRLGDRPPKVVALIGDGALGGGLAFEAMNHAGHARADLLVVLNDNDMSIAATVGAVGDFLERLRRRPEGDAANEPLRRRLLALLGARPDARDGAIVGVPGAAKYMLPRGDAAEAGPAGGSSSIDWLMGDLLRQARACVGIEHLFCALGFHYFGPVPGHDPDKLAAALAEVRDLPGPRLLHVVTAKGSGYQPAASDPEAFHSPPPFAVEVDAGAAPSPNTAETAAPETYTDIFASELVALAGRDPRLVALTAAMPAGTGIRAFARHFPERFIDVGIAESHAVALAASMASAGLRPVVAIYSTFLQRGYDQLIHDVALQPQAPVVFAIDRAGLTGGDGPTHHGLRDLAFLRGLPGFVVMAPRDGEELRRMLAYALTLDRPAAIRYPRGVPPPLSLEAPAEDAGAAPPLIGETAADALPTRRTALETGRAEWLARGADGVCLALGRMVEVAWRAARRLAREGVALSVVNARFADGFADDPLYEELSAAPVWFTLEDHALTGGYGGAVAEWLAGRPAGARPRLVRIAAPDRPVPHGQPAELDAELGLDVAGVMHTIRSAASRNFPERME